MIGSNQEARAIASAVGEFFHPSTVENKKLPQGWKFLGRGSVRAVFLSPMGVVYKLTSPIRNYINDDEFRFISTRRSLLPTGWRFPQTKLYLNGRYSIIAMEYIDGGDYECTQEDCCDGDIYECQTLIEICETINFVDLTVDNIRQTQDGIRYFVDCGEK